MGASCLIILSRKGTLFLFWKHFACCSATCCSYVFLSTLSEVEASTFVRKITSAIAYMHACGVIHRDLKPGALDTLDSSIGIVELVSRKIVWG